MQALTKDHYKNSRHKTLRLLKESVFIYPTDTIYGIGCDATNEALVRKIRHLKQTDNPFSVIVPSKKWLEANCIITEKAKPWLEKLPGPYTLILKLKRPDAVAGSVTYNNSIGVRMPKNWFMKVVKDLGFPVITTSANMHGSNFMTSLEDLPTALKQAVDYIFYEGEIKGRPSTLVHLEGDEVKIKKRD